jgi:TfoX/Sxy family transcriptional regulator of competence genes
MATTQDFAEFVCEQARGTGEVRYRKMFGEYMVYVDDKPILLLCDNNVYVKILPPLDEIMSGADKGIPYAGAKEHYVVDVDNAEFLRKIIEILLPITAIPKKRKKKV